MLLQYIWYYLAIFLAVFQFAEAGKGKKNDNNDSLANNGTDSRNGGRRHGGSVIPAVVAAGRKNGGFGRTGGSRSGSS